MTSLTATEAANNNPTVSKGTAAASSVASASSSQRTSDLILTQQFDPETQKRAVSNDVRAAPPAEHLQRGKSADSSNQALDVRKFGDRRSSSPFQNGRTELLIGAEDNNKLKTTAVVENNNNNNKKLEVAADSSVNR